MDKIVFLEPVFCERIWGGRNLEKFNFSIPQGNIGEAWVIAAHDNGSSKITNGQLAGLTLKEAYEKQPTLFTEKTYDKFPLLIKIGIIAIIEKFPAAYVQSPLNAFSGVAINVMADNVVA